LGDRRSQDDDHYTDCDGISVGLVALEAGETADQLTERADAAMLEVKATHHSRA
jgi:PleD family two-component response regulator